jgi:FAD/FMN-containing dehydrogenase
LASRPDAISVAALRDELDGQVVAPGDDGYDQARTIFYGGFDLRPQVIVRPTDAAGVARVVTLARDSGLELAVRSGGHSPAGHSLSDGGIVLDLSAMKALDLDPEGRSAWAQTGLTTGEYTTAAHAHGLATGFGDTASVGIGGLTLSGGVGYLVRKYGLTIDSLLAAELVTADGELVTASEQEHPDLFWAIRGGGGNLGVATRFHYRLQLVGQVFGGMLFLPATPEVVAGLVAESEAAPEELSGILNVMPAPPMPFVPAEHHGKLIVMALLVYAGDPADGERVLAPLRALATPLADMLRPMPYPEIYPPEEEAYHPTAIGHTMFMDRVDESVAKTILEHLQASDAPIRVTQLRVLGGAMARVPADATAFAHRSSRIMANVAAFYEGPDDKPAKQAWVDELAAALRQDDDGAYVGFLGEDGAARIHQTYPGSTWERLAAVKRRYDPDNLFRRNHNVPPAAEGR